MHEIIKTWREFMKEWEPAHKTQSGGGWIMLKPEFYDFMEWLAANKYL